MNVEVNRPSQRVRRALKEEASGMRELINKAKALDKLDFQKMTPKRLGQMKEFIDKLVALKNECWQLGLWATFRELQAAEKQVGWEVAQKMEKL